MALLDISQSYKNTRLIMKFMKKPYIQSLKIQFSSIIVSTTEEFSSWFSVFRWFEGSTKFITCAKSVILEKQIGKYCDICEYSGDAVD